MAQADPFWSASHRLQPPCQQKWPDFIGLPVTPDGARGKFCRAGAGTMGNFNRSLTTFA
jgi:hypothetical protein